MAALTTGVTRSVLTDTNRRLWARNGIMFVNGEIYTMLEYVFTASFLGGVGECD